MLQYKYIATKVYAFEITKCQIALVGEWKRDLWINVFIYLYKLSAYIHITYENNLTDDRKSKIH